MDEATFAVPAELLSFDRTRLACAPQSCPHEHQVTRFDACLRLPKWHLGLADCRSAHEAWEPEGVLIASRALRPA